MRRVHLLGKGGVGSALAQLLRRESLHLGAGLHLQQPQLRRQLKVLDSNYT